MPNNYFRDPTSLFSAPQMEMPEWVQMQADEGTPDMTGVFQGLKQRMQGGGKADSAPMTNAGKAMPSMSGKAGGSGGGGSL